MSNVIALNVLPRRQRLAERTDALIDGFARHRRIQDDVFWLKENAELLNILECTGTPVSQEALTPHLAFYGSLTERLQFFPQYYRFLLSIGLDLEDLGVAGAQMERLCEWVAKQGLPEAELSDLQRAEARRLLARRGVHTAAADPGLDDRLHAFINRPATFALPNKKAAYELTHIVFYLSEYGRKDPGLDPRALVSLEYAGILALLDQNMDLLAEICVAMRQAGQAANPVWEAAVRQTVNGFDVRQDGDAPLSDDYHEYLVANWACATAGQDQMARAVPEGRAVFQRPVLAAGALRPMSSALLSFADARSADWEQMQAGLYDMLDPDAGDTLRTSEASSPHFAAFFEQFARAVPA
ncbi:hypothetical protein [uncultured Tateyamaria sp.]|uniref:DUF6902 family protein n=1 Tax=uncultured Tateyamaria sp. TaxID=455651 RepID=UPI00262CD5A4|nr:hypothetical protein [uncultured Tateyamaria sp.]